jgi:hypothetical protein
VWSVPRCYEHDSLKNSGQCSVERSSALAALKKRVSWKIATVTRGSGCVKLKNLHYGWGRQQAGKRLSGHCGYL